MLFQTPFDKTRDKRDHALLEFELHHLYHIYWFLWRQLSWKKSLLVMCKVLRMFVNILTADHKYFLANRDIWRKPIQRQLFQNWKTFFQFVLALLKTRLNFEHFQKKKITLISPVFPELRIPNNCVRIPI